jgi:GntR family transcriptional regulator, carbon starvation induced regulator
MSESAPKVRASTSSTLSGMIYSTLRQDILLGELAPAGKLRIDQLCRRYGATSTPVREALNQLAMEGFVQRRDQRGFFVAEASMAELEQLTNTRCLVEPIALREALLHRTVAWEERLVLACHRLSRVDRSISAETYSENPAWEKAHRAFHMALIATCPSRWLVDFCGLLSDHAVRYRNLAMSMIYPQRDVAGEHRALMEAAIHGQADDAVTRLVEHYRRTAKIIETSTWSGAASEGHHKGD